MRFCGLEIEGKLLELAGLRVLGLELIVELPVVVVVVKGKKGGRARPPMRLLELEVVVVVVNGLCLLGEFELKGESSPLVKLGGIEYSYPHEGVLGCSVLSLGKGAVGVLSNPLRFVSPLRVSS